MRLLRHCCADCGTRRPSLAANRGSVAPPNALPASPSELIAFQLILVLHLLVANTEIGQLLSFALSRCRVDLAYKFAVPPR